MSTLYEKRGRRYHPVHDTAAIPTSPITGRAIRIPASALDAATAQQQPTQPIGRRVKVELPKGYRRLMG